MYRLVLNALPAGDRLAFELRNEAFSLSSVKTEGEGLFQLRKEEARFVPEAYYSGNDLLLNLPDDLKEPGVYQLYHGDRFIQDLAFNYTAEASRLNQFSGDALAQRFGAFGNVRILEASDNDSYRAAVSDLSSGSGIWKYALLLTLVFLAIETLLLRFMK